MSQHKKQNKKTGIGILIVAGIFIVAVILIAYLAMSIQSQASKSSLEINEQESVKNFVHAVASYTDERIKSSFNTLKGYSTGFSEAEKISEEQINAQLIRCSENGNFAALAYIDTSGNTYICGDLGENPRLYASEALEGEAKIFVANGIYAVPVLCAEGGIHGALVGKHNQDSEIESFNAYGVTGTCFILDTQGVIIQCSSTPTMDLNVGDNMVSALGVENDVNSLKTALSQTDINASKIIKYKGETYILAISSLETEDWTIVSAVPWTAVVAHSQNITTPMNYLVFGITALFVILAVYLLIYTNRIRKRVNTVIDENNKINYIDDITGHSSWKSFTENYEKKRLDTSVNLAFLSLDIDKFKTVNDLLGYEGGNEILRKLSQIISRDIGNNDIFARSVGDHFNILVEYKEKEDVIELVNHIISDIEYQITEVKLIVSIGIFLINDPNMKIRAVADRANVARNTIKNLSESQWAFFDNSMLDNIREEKSIENIMEDALEKGEFMVYLQPKYALGSSGGNVIGAEALVRWKHDGEIISPGRFIPIFEKNGFVTKLDFYMFREVCKLQKKWKNLGLEPKVISVNMSRLHFPNPEFVKTLSKCCEEFDIEPKYFEIEITESAAYENINILMNVFSEIKGAGFHVSIDDFGTGYSSLNMLKDLPVDVLKIDRSFLTENADETENASKIIACVVSLASSLDIYTICEGIETKEQANLLSKLGCNMAQGFYFARPMPVNDYEKLVYNMK